MRISCIFVLLALSLIFEGAFAWWAAAARGMEPLILSFGAGLAAIGLNNKQSLDHDEQLFDVKGWFKSSFTREDEFKHDPEQEKRDGIVKGPMTPEELKKLDKDLRAIGMVDYYEKEARFKK